ncbi:hypothetical protein BKA93DRAFT_880423 [Sparassis latifolia]
MKYAECSPARLHLDVLRTSRNTLLYVQTDDTEEFARLSRSRTLEHLDPTGANDCRPRHIHILARATNSAICSSLAVSVPSPTLSTTSAKETSLAHDLRRKANAGADPRPDQIYEARVTSGDYFCDISIWLEIHLTLTLCNPRTVRGVTAVLLGCNQRAAIVRPQHARRSRARPRGGRGGKGRDGGFDRVGGGCAVLRSGSADGASAGQRALAQALADEEPTGIVRSSQRGRRARSASTRLLLFRGSLWWFFFPCSGCLEPEKE